MKGLFTILFVLFFVNLHGQEIYENDGIEEIVPGITANANGMALIAYYQRTFKEGDFIFGPRVGFTYHPITTENSYFFWQNIVEYKGFFFSPFWLRRYDKSIGYQIPTTLGYKQKTNIAEIEIWGNYVYHARSFDLHIVISPKKRIILNPDY
jgi:hypothetical protein